MKLLYRISFILAASNAAASPQMSSTEYIKKVFGNSPIRPQGDLGPNPEYPNDEVFEKPTFDDASTSAGSSRPSLSSEYDTIRSKYVDDPIFARRFNVSESFLSENLVDMIERLKKVFAKEKLPIQEAYIERLSIHVTHHQQLVLQKPPGKRQAFLRDLIDSGIYWTPKSLAHRQIRGYITITNQIQTPDLDQAVNSIYAGLQKDGFKEGLVSALADCPN